MTKADGRIAVLEQELAGARRTAALQRERADAADRELGYAMLECGRLRAALGRLQAEPAPVALAGVRSPSRRMPVRATSVPTADAARDAELAR